MVTLIRRPDWPQRLADFLADRRAAAFAWGINDCCMFAADCVFALTGVDPGQSWRGAYESEATALVTLGGAPLADAIGAEMAGIGAVEVPPALAQRGDVVIVPMCVGAFREAAAVCVGRYACLPSATGLVHLPMRDAGMSWHF